MTLEQGGKSYVAEGLFGHETDTQDAEGEATLHAEWGHVTGEAVDRALGPFSGTIMQVPPMFSALHKDGKRLYELARQGVTVSRNSTSWQDRGVTVSRKKIINKTCTLLCCKRLVVLEPLSLSSFVLLLLPVTPNTWEVKLEVGCYGKKEEEKRKGAERQRWSSHGAYIYCEYLYLYLSIYIY